MDSSSMRSIGRISQSTLSRAMLLLLILFAASQFGPVVAIQGGVPSDQLLNNGSTRRIIGAVEVESGADRSSELLQKLSVTLDRSSELPEDQQLAILGAGKQLNYDPIKNANRPAKSNAAKGQPYTGRGNGKIYHNPGS